MCSRRYASLAPVVVFASLRKQRAGDGSREKANAIRVAKPLFAVGLLKEKSRIDLRFSVKPDVEICLCSKRGES